MKIQAFWHVTACRLVNYFSRSILLSRSYGQAVPWKWRQYKSSKHGFHTASNPWRR